MHVLDLFWALAAPDGSAVPRFFKPDLLHLSADGYSQWKEALLPMLRDHRVTMP